MSKAFHNTDAYIISIEDISRIHNSEHMVGVKILTDRYEILLSINDDLSCCEEWDYSKSKDFNIEELINAEILSIKDKEYNKGETYGIELLIKVQKINGELDEIRLFVENTHIGCYTHTYHLKYSDIEDFGEL
jgi:hypothetical protein